MSLARYALTVSGARIPVVLWAKDPRIGVSGLGFRWGFRAYSPPSVDRIWLWVDHNKIPIYPIVYLLKGDYRV